MQGAIPALFRTLRSQSDDARSDAHTSPCLSASRTPSLSSSLPPSLPPSILFSFAPSLSPSLQVVGGQHNAVCDTDSVRNELSKARCGADARDATPHS